MSFRTTRKHLHHHDVVRRCDRNRHTLEADVPRTFEEQFFRPGSSDDDVDAHAARYVNHRKDAGARDEDLVELESGLDPDGAQASDERTRTDRRELDGHVDIRGDARTAIVDGGLGSE